MSPSAVEAVSKGNGNASSNLEEHILAVLPFPEATEFFDKIRQRYPKSKITYYQPHATDVKSVEQYWKKDVEVPSGSSSLFQPTIGISNKGVQNSTRRPLFSSP
jgi:hypothetical protein